MSLLGLNPHYLEIEGRSKLYIHYDMKSIRITVPEDYKDISFLINVAILKDQRILTYDKQTQSFIIFKIKDWQLELEKVIKTINAPKGRMYILAVNKSETKILFRNGEDDIYLYDVVKETTFHLNLDDEMTFDKAEFIDDIYFSIIYDDVIFIFNSDDPEKPIYERDNAINVHHLKRDFLPFCYNEFIVIPSPNYFSPDILNINTGEISLPLESKNFHSFHALEEEGILYAIYFDLSVNIIMVREWKIANETNFIRTETYPYKEKHDFPYYYFEMFNPMYGKKKTTWKENQYPFPVLTKDEKEKQNEQLLSMLPASLAKPLRKIIARFIIQ